jgi:hypothetical protein
MFECKMFSIVTQWTIFVSSSFQVKNDSTISANAYIFCHANRMSCLFKKYVDNPVSAVVNCLWLVSDKFCYSSYDLLALYIININLLICLSKLMHKCV